MAVKVRQGFIDRSRENSSTQYYVDGPAAGDDFTDAIADANTIKGAMSALTLCNYTRQTASIVLDEDVPTIPSSAFAQREVGLTIQYVDTVTGKYYDMTIPGPDLTLLAQANTDEVDIASNATFLAYSAIVEPLMVSEVGNAVEIVRARIVGRRS